MKVRNVVAGTGIFFGMSALGGFIEGFTLWNGDYIALACLSSGIALTAYLCWMYSKTTTPQGGHLLSLIVFALVAGLALYSNLCWALWALDVPVSIGTVKNGRMGENYFLGPVTLLFAVFCYLSMKMNAAKHGD